MLSWGGFTEMSGRFLARLVVVGAVVALIGAVARWRRVPGMLVLGAQVVGGTVATTLVVAGTPLPGEQFRSLLAVAWESAQLYAAPVPQTDTVTVQPLLVIGGLVAMLLVDLLGVTLRRVPLAGLPLLTVYSVPVSMLGGGVSWWVFVLTATGFLLLLYLQEQNDVGRWGRSLDPDAEIPRRRSEAVRGGATLVGVLATAAAVVLPLAVPTLDLRVFDIGMGPGDDQIRLSNPMADLRRDLERGEDVPLVTVTTEDPNPRYLRTSVLERFSDNRWSPGDRDVPTSNVPRGKLPPLPGVSRDVDRTEYDYDVDVSDTFESRWLPTQAPISRIEAEGAWRYDEQTRDFVASEPGLTAAGMEYSMTAVELDIDPADLTSTESSPLISDDMTALPDDLPEIVSRLAFGVTADAGTDLARAAALQRWFRSDGGFTYSLEEAPSTQVGTDELAAFLDPDARVGYCEQFAAAMAVMARALGIPARVAVGFLSPERLRGEPDTWVYSAHDLHAWVELYFPGAGWVLFDPTPPQRVPEVPGYTQARAPIPDPGSVPGGQPDERPVRPRPTGLPSPQQRQQPEAPGTASQGAAAESGSAWTTALGWTAGLLLLGLLLAAPRTLRTRERSRRLAGGPEEAWAELRATCLDLGVTWPRARSPRETRRRLVERFGSAGAGPDASDVQRPRRGPEADPAAVEALERLVVRVERHRYAASDPERPGQEHGEGGLGADVERCRAALAAGTSPQARRRATWMPRSVWQRRRLTEPEATPSELVGS